MLASAQHFVGNGTFDWKRQGFVFDLPESAGGLSLALGNAGTGEMLVTDVEFRKLDDGDAIPVRRVGSCERSSPQAGQRSGRGDR